MTGITSSTYENDFICIHCGQPLKELYKKYSLTVLKLANCVKCNYVADKYIEYDPIIVIIDLILLRKEAYRHILYNTNFESHWKLAVMLQVMEIYSEWNFLFPKSNINTNATNSRDLQFFLLSLRIVFRTIFAILSIFFLTLVYNKLFNKKREFLNTSNFLIIWKAVILSNFGLFLLLPSLIWDYSVQEYHLTFVSLYTTFSQLLAYTVVCNCFKVWSIIVIITSFYVKMLGNEFFDNVYHFLNYVK